MSSSRRVLLTLALGFAACGEAGGTDNPDATPGGSGGAAGSSAGSPVSGGTAPAGGTSGSAPVGGTSAGTDAGGTDAAGNAGESGDAGEAGAGPEPLKPPFDWVGIVGTGQSLSVGATAGNISLEQPYGNLRLVDSGPDPQYPITGGAPKWSLAPLVEPVRAKLAGYTDTQYPNNIAGETPHSGMANTLSWLWKARGAEGEYVTVHSVVGWGGHKLIDIDKGGGKRAYPGSLSEARVYKQLADEQGKSFGYGAIIMTHGESDASTEGYGEGLYQLYKDYNADLKAITGQTSDIPMLVSQQSTKASGSAGSAAQVFRASLDHPGEIICTGPKYQYQYGNDKLHFGAAGYRRLGEKYAQIFDLVVNQQQAWEPLRPLSAKRNGNVIAIQFHVPEPPLVWSTHLAAPHQTLHKEWAKGRGFEVTTGAGAAVTISAAAIEGDTVRLTLQNPPATNVALTVGYALTQDGKDNQGGSVDGLRGQLRDSDPFIGADQEAIEVKVTQGSNVITAAQKGAFRRRTGFDIITESGTKIAVVVRTRDSDDQLTLSGPWTEASATRTLSFNYDLYNYAVHFALPVQ